MNNKILIIDDDEAIRSGLRKILEKRHYEVSTAACGREADEAVRQNLPDLVITDYYMSDTNGLSLCARLRHYLAANDCRPRLILLTGCVTKEIMEQAADAGIDRCIAKPVETSVLLGEIDSLLKAG